MSSTKSPKRTTTLLIDADLYLYRAAAGAEEQIDWGDDLFSLATDLKVAKKTFIEQLNTFKTELGADEAILCFSDRENFRKEVDPEYKSNRKKTRKPVGFAELIQWAKGQYTHIQKPGLEGDDCMGILATGELYKDCSIIVSDDKDMRSVPCKLYRPSDDIMYTISEKEADAFFLTQCLTGDSADGYSGIPGIGPKKAEAILGARPDWSLVEAAYIKHNMTRDDAIRMARLARILRISDWDSKANKHILWEPRRAEK